MSKVEFRPFSASITKNAKASIFDFASHIAATTGDIQTVDKTRIVSLGQMRGRVLCGAAITLLGDAEWQSLDLSNGEFKRWRPDDSSQEYRLNLYVLLPDHGCGLYQSMQDTLPIAQYRDFAKELYGSWRRFLRANRMDKLKGDGVPEDEARTTSERELQMGRLTIKPRMTQDQFKKLVKELSEVKEYSYSLDYTTANSGIFTPTLNKARSVSGRVRFDGGQSRVGAQIARLVGRFRHQKATVRGVDQDGVERVYRLTQHHEVIERMTTVEWRRRLPQKVDDLLSCQAMESMLSIVERNQQAFRAQPEAENE